MDARDIAGDLFGANNEQEEGRPALMRAYERLGERPRFEIQEPYNTTATRNFHVFRTTFSYVFDPETPWLPDQIVNELRAQYDRMNAAGEFKTDNIMVSYTVQEKTPGLAEYPYAATTRAAARRAVEGRRTGLHRQNRNNVDWGGLLAQILREDHYDALDGAENTMGNRLSRVVFEFTEYRIPYGRGATQDLGLMPRALVDLPDIGNGLCGQACLAYAISPPSIQKNMRIPARKDLLKAAVAMAEKINVKTSMNITEFDIFTLMHPEYTVVIMGSQTQVLYATKSAAVIKQPVYLLLYLGHYYNINNMDTFVRPTPHAHLRWCDFCMEPVRSRVAHACRGSCTSCRHVFVHGNTAKNPPGAPVLSDKEAHMVPCPDKCANCNFDYVYAGCKEYHRCNQYKCLDCKAVMPLKRKPVLLKPVLPACNKLQPVELPARNSLQHICGELYCGYCDVAVLPDATGKTAHRCFILKTSPPVPAENPPIYVYDIESVLDPIRTTSCSDQAPPYKPDSALDFEASPHPVNLETDFEASPHPVNLETDFEASPHPVNQEADFEAKPHPVNLEDSVHKIAVIVAMKLNSRELHIFKGPTVEQDFLRWIDSFTVLTTLIAHNGASYDSYMILAATRRHKIDMPTALVVIGSKIPYMKYKHVRFIDSMKHVTGSLESVAKTFGLDMKKSFFPYTFYTSATLQYVGDIPDRKYFGFKPLEIDHCVISETFESPQKDKNKEFEAWYGSFAPGAYSIEDEVVKYCVQDCEILCRAMEKYRDAGVLANSIDPLDKVTIAGYAMATYRARHMPEKTFPILTTAEYKFVRQGLFGGRTDVRQIMKSWELDPFKPLKEQKHGLYVDVHSMYPSVQKFDLLPVGAPWWCTDVLQTPEKCSTWLQSINQQGVCAMVECTVVCPRDLYHPVLLEKRDGRLVAALDITSGVFTSYELLKALEVGYKVTTIAKSLCSHTSSTTFASYVDKFGAMKEMHGKTGPQPNPGLCALAKMMLNSLWGKFSQKDDLVESRIYTDEAMWFRTVAAFNSGRYSELEVHEITPSYIFATSTAAAGENVHLRTTDVLLAAFVTAQARLRLYAMLSLIGERVIYHDTDSIVYEYVPGMPDVPLGDHFGEWGSELGKNHVMTDFVALGPKTYAYSTANFLEKSLQKTDFLEKSLQKTDFLEKSLQKTDFLEKSLHKEDFLEKSLHKEDFLEKGESPPEKKVVVKSKGFTSGFSIEQYLQHAKAFLAGCCLAPLEQKPLHFARAPVKSGKSQTMTTIAGYIKKLSMSTGKMFIKSAERTLPFGHQEAL